MFQLESQKNKAGVVTARKSELAPWVDSSDPRGIAKVRRASK